MVAHGVGFQFLPHALLKDRHPIYQVLILRIESLLLLDNVGHPFLEVSPVTIFLLLTLGIPPETRDIP